MVLLKEFSNNFQCKTKLEQFKTAVKIIFKKWTGKFIYTVALNLDFIYRTLKIEYE